MQALEPTSRRQINSCVPLSIVILENYLTLTLVTKITRMCSGFKQQGDLHYNTVLHQSFEYKYFNISLSKVKTACYNMKANIASLYIKCFCFYSLKS